MDALEYDGLVVVLVAHVVVHFDLQRDLRGTLWHVHAVVTTLWCAHHVTTLWRVHTMAL